MTHTTLPLHKKLLFSLIMIILVPVLMLALAEIMVMLFSNAGTEYGFSRYPYRRDPAVGRRLREGYKTVYNKPEFRVPFQMNKEGFRSSSEFIVGDAGNKTIAFLGDSFVEAIQVVEDSTFVMLLENRLGPAGIAQVQNYGTSNMGVVHYLQMYTHYVRPHKPAVVVICILDQNDIRNSSPELEPRADMKPGYVTNDTGKITGVEPFKYGIDPMGPEGSWFQKTFGDYALYRFTDMLIARYQLQDVLTQFPLDAYVFEEPWQPSFEEAWGYASWSLQQLIHEIRSDGAEPMVVMMASSWTTSDALWQALTAMYNGAGRLERDKISRMVAALCREEEVPFFDAAEPLREAYRTGVQPHWHEDGHLNPTGHTIVADAMHQAILESGLVPNTALEDKE